jgi:hypothetical protein
MSRGGSAVASYPLQIRNLRLSFRERVPDSFNFPPFLSQNNEIIAELIEDHVKQKRELG